MRKDPRNALNHLRANEKQKNDLYSHPMSENGFMFMPIIFESLRNTLPEVRSFMFKIYKKFTSFYEKYVFDDSIKNLPTLKH